MRKLEAGVTLPFETTDDPRTQRDYHVIHFPDSDIVINNYASRVAWAPKLVELFKGGIPENWEVLNPVVNTESEEDERRHPQDYISGPKSGMMKGSVDGVEFMLKPKSFMLDREYSPLKTKYVNEGDIEGIRFLQRMHSILKEMGLARKVKELSASPEMQGIARKYGYKGIRYEEPVIAVVYRDTGRKYLIYEYIPNTQEVFDILMNKKDFATNDAFDADLWKFFDSHGIVATELDTGHLLVDQNNMLNIIDIENYRRKVTSAD